MKNKTLVHQNYSVLEKIPIAVCILNFSGEIVYINPSFTSLFGYRLDEIPSIQAWMEQAYPDQAYRKEIIEFWNNAANKRANDNKSGSEYCPIKTCKDNSKKNVEVSFYQYEDETHLYFNYLGQASQEIEALQIENEFNETIINNLPGIFYLFKWENSTYRLKKWNKNSELILGYTGNELFNREPDSFFLPGESNLIYSILCSLEFSGGKEIELNLRLKGGISIPHLFTMHILNAKTGKYFVGSAFDISKTKEAEKTLLENELVLRKSNDEFLALNEELTQSYEELKSTNEALQNVRLKAEESDLLKTAFLQNMSHEIRTPLNGILGFASLLTDSRSTEEQRIYYGKIINESSNQLLSIVDDIINISKIETGQSEVVKNIIIPANLIEDLIAAYLPKAKEKQIEIVKETSSNSNELAVITDEGKLWQILNNLINNALKFSTTGTIKVGFGIEYSKLRFWVKDTGIGIAKEYHQKIFERFRQIDLDLTRNYGGTGLGLTIAKANAELLGGNIWVESESGKGSDFYFYIAYTPHKQAHNTNANPSQIESQEKLGGLNILIAEDEEINFLLLEEMLIDLDAKIYRAVNGLQAVELVEQIPEINLILMDIKMPEMNGFEAHEVIRNIRPGIPIIAQTAYAFIADKQKVLDAGFAGYISKPILKSDLINLIRKFIPHLNLIAD